jgi:hypothetical protein
LTQGCGPFGDSSLRKPSEKLTGSRNVLNAFASEGIVIKTLLTDYKVVDGIYKGFGLIKFRMMNMTKRLIFNSFNEVTITT